MGGEHIGRVQGEKDQGSSGLDKSIRLSELHQKQQYLTLSMTHSGVLKAWSRWLRLPLISWPRFLQVAVIVGGSCPTLALRPLLWLIPLPVDQLLQLTLSASRVPEGLDSKYLTAVQWDLRRRYPSILGRMDCGIPDGF